MKKFLSKNNTEGLLLDSKIIEKTLKTNDVCMQRYSVRNFTEIVDIILF